MACDITPKPEQNVSAQRYARPSCFGLGVTSQVTSSMHDALISVIEINGDQCDLDVTCDNVTCDNVTCDNVTCDNVTCDNVTCDVTSKPKQDEHAYRLAEKLFFGKHEN